MLESLNPSLIVPLHLKNRINGILFMGERIFIEGFSSEYNDYERNEISTIASLASVAVHNASLIEQSSTDMMTHLKLKYYFFNMLEDKLDAACSQGQNIAVVAQGIFAVFEGIAEHLHVHIAFVELFANPGVDSQFLDRILIKDLQNLGELLCQLLIGHAVKGAEVNFSHLVQEFLHDRRAILDGGDILVFLSRAKALWTRWLCALASGVSV